jgi:hypothetical protein
MVLIFKCSVLDDHAEECQGGSVRSNKQQHTAGVGHIVGFWGYYFFLYYQVDEDKEQQMLVVVEVEMEEEVEVEVEVEG